MEIRSATEADLSALIPLLRGSWLTTWAPELPFAAVQRFAADDPARHYAESMWREFVVAEDGGALVGMFHVKGNWLNAIHLDPKRKRQGIGSRLMDEVERRISAPHREARLEVRAFNIGAIDFHKQRGWTEQRRYEGKECGEPVETIEMIKLFSAR
ncbi:N-acetyltransferase family protein [Candidatus Binatus sp.]|jgi:ribosomal protein S18 acetylase RimI-like enzyme|uniref:GNAT family N-acetyltransferase n=1 Tax=Candidatus Binatus sp. TaxID=2811406 RepID=UPI003BEB2C72